MKCIYKYRVPFMETSTVAMPDGAEVIRVDGLDGAIWMWAIVDTNNPLVGREFKLYKTGGEMPSNIEDYNYIGCGAIFVQMELMMYLFEHKYYTPEKVIENVNDFDWKAVQEIKE